MLVVAVATTSLICQPEEYERKISPDNYCFFRGDQAYPSGREIHKKNLSYFVRETLFGLPEEKLSIIPFLFL